jgi:hypothetical protein
MFDLEKVIADWRQHMLAAGIKAPVPLAELESHLRDHIDRLKAGLSEEDAFQIAARELGDGKILIKEFSKGKFLRLIRNNPVVLNILAGWFILSGLNVVSQLVRWMLYSGGIGTSFFYRMFFVLEVLFSLQLFVGIGLLLRRELWWYCALGFSVFGIIFAAWSVVGTLIGPQMWNSPGRYFVILGVLIPMKFMLLTDLLKLGMLSWGIYILTKSSVRNLFRPATAS